MNKLEMFLKTDPEFRDKPLKRKTTAGEDLSIAVNSALMVPVAGALPAIAQLYAADALSDKDFNKWLNNFKNKYPAAVKHSPIVKTNHPLKAYFDQVKKQVGVPTANEAVLLHELGHAEIDKSKGFFKNLQDYGVETAKKVHMGKPKPLDYLKYAGVAATKPFVAPVYEGKAWANALKHSKSKLSTAAQAILPMLSYVGGAVGTGMTGFYGGRSIGKATGLIDEE